MTVERFGTHPTPPTREKILRPLEDDLSSLIGDRCPTNMYIYSGLEHAMPQADGRTVSNSPMTGSVRRCHSAT
jgi:hypothetical protein